jgi:hypothetical protein
MKCRRRRRRRRRVPRMAEMCLKMHHPIEVDVG